MLFKLIDPYKVYISYPIILFPSVKVYNNPQSRSWSFECGFGNSNFDRMSKGRMNQDKFTFV